MKPLVGLLEKLALHLGALSGFAVLAMMVVIILDVGGRAMFNLPVAGGNELSELLLVGLIFLGLAAAQQRRQHYTVDIAMHLFGPTARRVLDIGGLLLSLAVVALLAWLSAQQAWTATVQGEASYGTISFPIWPARIVIAFGLGLLALQLAIDIIKAARGVPGDDADRGPANSAG